MPISAVSGLALPIIGDLVTGEAPALIHLAGVAIAIFSVVLFGTAADAGPVAAPARTSVLLGLATGLGFGISDLGLGLMPEDLAVGALMFARLSGAAAAAVVVAVLMPRRAGSIVAGLAVGAPGRSARLLGLALALAAGLLDATGQLAYVLAATRGQMSIAAATTALYPAVVVALSIWLLKERICRTQLTGMLAGGVSIALMAA